MKVIGKDQSSKEDLTNSPIFFGGRVTLQTIVGKDMNCYYNFTLVSFEAGARNKFHAHTSDQVLYVTEGAGVVATEEDEVMVKEGDTAWIPAGQKHWHGASPDSNFTHISLQTADSSTSILE